MQQHYRPDLIEPAVQQYWAENKVFKAIKDTSKEKFISLHSGLNKIYSQKKGFENEFNRSIRCWYLGNGIS